MGGRIDSICPFGRLRQQRRLTGSGGHGRRAEDTASAADDTAADDAQEAENGTEAEEPSAEKVILKCVCDLTPHSEILDAARDALAAEGIELNLCPPHGMRHGTIC